MPKQELRRLVKQFKLRRWPLRRITGAHFRDADLAVPLRSCRINWSVGGGPAFTGTVFVIVWLMIVRLCLVGLPFLHPHPRWYWSHPLRNPAF